METIEVNGSIFYIDEESKRISGIYDVSSYRGSSSTIGESNTEIASGRLLFLARMCGQIVGSDFESYRREYPGEQWFDSVDHVHDEGLLERYLDRAGRRISERVSRIVVADRKVFFPTEPLVKLMLKGKKFIPPGEYLFKHLRN